MPANFPFCRTKRYLIWRSEYEKVYEKFIKKHLPDSPSNPVKIAILDTGIDRDHYVFEARKENLGKMRNCYNESQMKVLDRNGHGTFVASLILDYAPDAELYIIKIADKKNATPDAKIVVNVSSWIGIASPRNIQELTHTGDQPRSRRMGCGHHFDVVWVALLPF